MVLFRAQQPMQQWARALTTPLQHTRSLMSASDILTDRGCRNEPTYVHGQGLLLGILCEPLAVQPEQGDDVTTQEASARGLSSHAQYRIMSLEALVA
jgi:hypothetical protein